MPPVLSNPVEEANMDTPPPTLRPRFYIVRPEPSKALVPLIALDELPSLLRIEGVPLSLDRETIDQWSMARVGDTTAFNGEYKISLDHEEFFLQKAKSALGVSDKQGVKDVGPSAQTSLATSPSKTPNTESQSPTSANGHEAKAQAAMDDVAEKAKWEKQSDPSKTKNAMTPGIYGRKRYCTHWIRTGNCDYVQEGCKYLHVIPDEATRLSIGIRDMPRWAREDLPPPAHQVPCKTRPPIQIPSTNWRLPARSLPASTSGEQKASELPASSHASKKSAYPAKGQGKPHVAAREKQESPARKTPVVSLPSPQATSKPFRNNSDASVVKSYQRQLDAKVVSPRVKLPSTTSSPKWSGQPSAPGAAWTLPPSPGAYSAENVAVRTDSATHSIGENPTQTTFPGTGTQPRDRVSATPSAVSFPITPQYQYGSDPFTTMEPIRPSSRGIDHHTMQPSTNVSPNNAGQISRYTLPERHYPSGLNGLQQLLQNTVASFNQQQHQKQQQQQQRRMSPAMMPPSPSATAPQHFGPIGEGRPSSATASVPRELTPFPKRPAVVSMPQNAGPNATFHRRLFVAPGESEYVLAQPEEEEPKRSVISDAQPSPPTNKSGNNSKHGNNGGKNTTGGKKKNSPRGRGKNNAEPENLISFDDGAEVW